MSTRTTNNSFSRGGEGRFSRAIRRILSLIGIRRRRRLGGALAAVAGAVNSGGGNSRQTGRDFTELLLQKDAERRARRNGKERRADDAT